MKLKISALTLASAFTLASQASAGDVVTVRHEVHTGLYDHSDLPAIRSAQAKAVDGAVQDLRAKYHAVDLLEIATGEVASAGEIIALATVRAYIED